MNLSIIRPSWPGFSKIKYLIIFGDSYSDVGYRGGRMQRATAEEPIAGSPYGLWNEPGLPNWVGHLVTNRLPEHQLLVYDHAIGGNQISGIGLQIQYTFVRTIAPRPDWAAWTPTDSLFVTWIGINDCAYKPPELDVYQKPLFTYQKRLYDAGARNFLFIDVPPMERCPGSKGPGESPFTSTWNAALRANAERFAEDRPDATVLIFSANALFNQILDNPAEHGFDLATAHIARGCIWWDRIHITSQMHGLVARGLEEFLASQPAPEGPGVNDVATP